MTSEYQLNLKAVLDSTQVQQELNKLRQSTSQALGGENARSNAQAPSGNLTSLGSTLNNLNQTLNRLNQTLGQLRGIAPSHNTTSQSRGPAGPFPFSPISPQIQRAAFNRSIEKYYDINKAIQSDRQKLTPKQRTEFKHDYNMDINDLAYNLLFGDQKQFKNAYKATEDIIGSKLSTKRRNNLLLSRSLTRNWMDLQNIPKPLWRTFIDQQTDEYLRSINARKQAAKSPFSPNNTLRMMRLFGGQYLAGELGNLGASIGGRTGALISGGTDAAQSGLMTGVSMSMMGMSPISAAVAGIAVAAAKIQSVMLEYAQKLSQAAEKSYALLSRSKEQIREQYKSADSIRFSRGLKEKDFQQLTELKSQYEASTESAYSRYMTLSEGQQNALSTVRQEYLERIGGTSDIDERQKIEQEYAYAVAKIVGSVNKAKEQWEESANRQQEINAALEAVKSEYKDRRSYRYYLDRKGTEGYSDTDVASRSSIWSQRASRIQEELNAEIAKNDMSEEGMRRRRQLQSMYGEYQSEADFWENQTKSRESAREDIQKDILAQERIREIEAIAKKYDFSKGYASDENRRDILKDFEGSRTDISGQYMQSQRNIFDFQKQMMQALKEAASDNISATDRAAKLKEASTLDEQIQNEKNRMNVLGAAYTSLGGLKVEELQDALSRLQAPSKDRATSLAQYGYNMGEKNDDEQRWQSELQYLKDQKQIQDDIKAILNDKLPSPATFA